MSNEIPGAVIPMPHLYVQGIGTAIMTDFEGNIKYFSDKFLEGNIAVSADEGVITADVGNGPVIVIPTNPNVTVTVTAADYSEYAKAAAVGARITYGAPDMVCQTVIASGTSLTISLANGTPVAGPGMTNIVCYVQTVGDTSQIVQDGVAYAIDPTSGAIDGFTATDGAEYLVTYYVSRANASMTTITTNPKGEVVRFVLQRPIYTNVESSANQGDLWGMLYEIIPRLQLMPDGAANSGNQNSPTTTTINGRAMVYDSDTANTDCESSSLNGVPLMYRIIVPCDHAGGIDGILGALGGSISLPEGYTFQIHPAVIVNGRLSYSVPVTDFSYISSETSVATVGAGTGIISGVSEGNAVIIVMYTVESETYTDYINVEITSAVHTPPLTYYGLSTDIVKPTANVGNGAIFMETDTSKLYLFSAEDVEWLEWYSSL